MAEPGTGKRGHGQGACCLRPAPEMFTCLLFSRWISPVEGKRSADLGERLPPPVGSGLGARRSALSRPRAGLGPGAA